MAPFRNAMCFINSNQANFGSVDHLNKPFVIEPLGGNISIKKDWLTFILDDHVEGDLSKKFSPVQTSYSNNSSSCRYSEYD